MKLWQITLMVAVLTIGSWYFNQTQPKKVKQEVPVEEVAPEPPKVELKVEPPKEIPKPPRLEVVVPKIDYDKLPDGEFYVKERVSKITDSGVKSFNVGEKIYKTESGYSNGRFTLDINIPAEKLTSSISEGLALAPKSEPIPLAEVKTPTQTQKNTPPPTTYTPVVNPRIFEIERQIAALEQELTRLKIKYTNSSGKINASGPFIQRIENQIKKLQAERAALR